ncbi:MAG: LVIVD repeat-containing protein [Candidatus Thorarchaeota archaeon]
MVLSRRHQLVTITLLTLLIVGVTITFVYFSQSADPPEENPPGEDSPEQNPQDLNLIGEVDTGGQALRVHIDGDTAYVLDADGSGTLGLVIVDISESSQPAILGTYHNGGLPFDVVSEQNIVYIADQFEGLRIIDVSNPANPVELEGYSGSGMAFDVEVVGDYLYFADYDLGMVILDISTPNSPVFVSNLDTGCVHLEIEENIAYIAGHGNLKLVDVSDPTQPTILGQTTESSTTLWDPSVANGTIYLANHSGDDGELMIFNASNPSNIELIAEFDSDGTFQSFYIQNSLLYAVDYEAGLYLLDVRNSSSPVEITRFSEGQPWDVTLSDGLVYLVGTEGLQILQAVYT